MGNLTNHALLTPSRSPSPRTDYLANLPIRNKDDQNPQAPSPNAMLVDTPEEHIVEPNGVDNDDVAIITPEADEKEAPVLATDCELDNTAPSILPRSSATDAALDKTMKEHVLPALIDEPPILEDQVHTWEIKGWRNLNKKEHGPTFHAGGFPWSVSLGGSLKSAKDTNTV